MLQEPTHLKKEYWDDLVYALSSLLEARYPPPHEYALGEYTYRPLHRLIVEPFLQKEALLPSFRDQEGAIPLPLLTRLGIHLQKIETPKDVDSDIDHKELETPRIPVLVHIPGTRSWPAFFGHWAYAELLYSQLLPNTWSIKVHKEDLHIQIGSRGWIIYRLSDLTSPMDEIQKLMARETADPLTVLRLVSETPHRGLHVTTHRLN